ncbi:hypothetical protein M9Y10_012586 [Tritrichomonas musculus]|uniref:Uncharacterized protein n=1 Tax=Tritrichomonas musculus TaxID=1915356 RepID=A0ABR2ICY2_9EUKA
METLVEHINIQVEELLSNEVIHWQGIFEIINKLQSFSIPLSESLINLISQIKDHYEKDLIQAKKIYQNKSLEYELLTAKMQLNEMHMNDYSTEHDEAENDDDFDFDNDQENQIILEGIKTTETFNFPMVNEVDSCTDNKDIELQDTSICSCNSFEIPNPKYANASTQEEYYDSKKIYQLVYENNQYLKIAKSWKMQCEAAVLKMEEMKIKRKKGSQHDFKDD